MCLFIYLKCYYKTLNLNIFLSYHLLSMLLKSAAVQ